MAECNLLHEIAERISEWKKFARIIGIEESFIQRTDRDKFDCYEKTHACLYEKVETVNTELNWAYWKTKLLQLGDEGKRAIIYLEINLPHFLGYDDKDDQYKNEIDHFLLKSGDGGIFGHNDEGIQSFDVLQMDLKNKVKICVGAGKFKMYDHKNFDEWEKIKESYCDRYDITNKNLCYDFSTIARNKRCKILTTLSNFLNDADDKGFAVKGYSICNHFDLFSKNYKAKEQNSDSYVLMYSQKENVMLHIETDPQNLRMVWRNNLNRIKLLRSLNPWIKDGCMIHIPLLLLNENSNILQPDNSCNDCEDLQLIVSDDKFKDLTKFQTWWMEILTNKHGSVKRMRQQLDTNIDNKKASRKLLSSIITYMALTDFYLPTFTNNPEDQIEDTKKLMMLSSEQIDIFYSEHKHMIIKGSFGSGKSIVAQQRFKKVVETESTEALFYYVCHDQESDFVKEMKRDVESLNKENIIVCNSFELVGDDYKLSSILKHISRLNVGKIVHILLEEFNGEVIDEDEIQKIIPLLEEKYVNSHIILIAQSFECKRYKKGISSEPVPLLKYQYESLTNQTDFTIFNLSHTMRSSNKINTLVDRAIPIIQSAKIQSIIPKIEKLTENLKYPNTMPSSVPSSHVNNMEHRVIDDNDSVIESDTKDGNISDRQSANNKHEDKIKKKVINKDEILKIFTENKNNYEAYVSMESEFEFIGKREKGHKIDGQLPELYYPFSTKGQSLSHEIYCLILILKKILENGKKYVIIYFNRECFYYLYVALKAIDKKFTTSSVDFSEVDNIVWLAKYTAVRGCEFPNVIFAYPLGERYLKQNIVTALSRCMYNLKIIVFNNKIELPNISLLYPAYPYNDDETLVEILNKWESEKLVTSYRLIERYSLMSYIYDERFYLDGNSKKESLSKHNDYLEFTNASTKFEDFIQDDDEYDFKDPNIIQKMGLESQSKSLNKATFNALCKACEKAELRKDIELLENVLHSEDANINSTFEGNTLLLHHINNVNYYQNDPIGNKLWMMIGQTKRDIFIIQMLLFQTSIDVNIQEASGKTALHLAAKYKNLTIINALAISEIDVNIKDRHGRTALHYAVEANEIGITKALLKQSADVNLTSKVSGRTVLHKATIHNNTDIVRLLLTANINTHIKDKFGETAYDIAKKRNYLEIENLLLDQPVYSVEY